MVTDWVVIVPSQEPGLSHVRLVPHTARVEDAVERVVRDVPPADGTVWAFPMDEVIGFSLETKVRAVRSGALIGTEG